MGEKRSGEVQVRALLELSKGRREWSLQWTAKQSRGGSVRQCPCSAARRKRESSSLHCKAAEQNNSTCSSIPAFVPSPSASSLFIPSFPVQAKGEKYSQGYIHCIPYGKVSFVTRLSPLHPGYVSTVCAPTLCSHPPNHTAITATDKSDENMVIYTVYVRFFLTHSLTHSTNSDTGSCVEGRCKSSVDGRRTESKIVVEWKYQQA
jgi:hypothetical protein